MDEVRSEKIRSDVICAAVPVIIFLILKGRGTRNHEAHRAAAGVSVYDLRETTAGFHESVLCHTLC